MARINKNPYPSIKKDQLNHPIVFVVDMVNGFIKEGALHDGKIMDVVEPIQSLLEEYNSIFVCDNHPEDAREFQAYPKHCVIGTSEAQVIDELQKYNKNQIEKNSTNTFFSPGFQDFLEEDFYQYDDYIITGCCTDLCILQFALSFHSWLNQNDYNDKRIIIPVDCVETYHIDGNHDAGQWNEMALENMATNGIQIVSRIEGE